MTFKLPNDWKKYAGTGALVMALTAILNFALDWREGDQVTNQTLLKQQQTIIQRQQLEIDELRVRIIDLEREKFNTEYRLNLLSSVNFESPVAMWIKDTSGRMVTLNKKYEELFLTPNGKGRYDYIGSTDSAFWASLGEAELGESYYQNDLEIIRTRNQQRFIEYAFVKGKRLKIIVYKYPVWSDNAAWDGRTIIGVGGVAVIAECP